MEKPSSLLTFMASPAMKYSSVPSTKFKRVIINTSRTERHKDDIADETGREEGTRVSDSRQNRQHYLLWAGFNSRFERLLLR